ncbi:hypothetical protein GLYMA_17G196133v4 [Glycine max]|nr:hypothetical protein GLYMA_17G196133v4 [Glycine max]KAH1119199.1 hypothetical protein GYH30_047837 [Glycine max]
MFFTKISLLICLLTFFEKHSIEIHNLTINDPLELEVFWHRS